MKITAAKADAFAKAPDPKLWAVLVYGPDRGLARERAKALLTGYGVAQDDPFALASLDESEIKGDPARLEDELRALSFGGGDRAVRLAITGDAAATALTAVLKALDAGAYTPAARLIVEAGELTPRSKIRKAFEGAKTAAALPCYRDEARDLARLAEDTLRAAGVTLSEDARATLIPRLEGDRALARGALDTLVLYAGDQREPLSAADVDAVIAGAEPADLDAIAAAALEGRALEADAAFLRALEAGAAPVGVCRAVQRAVARLQSLKAAMVGGASADEALNGLRPPAFGPRRAALKTQLRHWSDTRLNAAASRVFDTERALKQSSAPDAALCGRMLLALAQMAGR